jgi:hypothetical protein
LHGFTRSALIERALEYTITGDLCTGLKIAPAMDNQELELRLKECQEFLQKNANINCSDEIQPADGSIVEKGTHHDSICMGAL